MSDFCINSLVMSGNIKSLRAFDRQFKKEHLTYNSNTKSIANRRGYSLQNFIPITEQEFLDNEYVEYEKWGSHDINLYHKTELNTDDNRTLTNIKRDYQYFFHQEMIELSAKAGEMPIFIYTFSTKGWHPHKAMHAMAEKHPSLIVFHYARLYDSFNLIAKFKHGELVSVIDCDTVNDETETKHDNIERYVMDKPDITNERFEDVVTRQFVKAGNEKEENSCRFATPEEAELGGVGFFMSKNIPAKIELNSEGASPK